MIRVLVFACLLMVGGSAIGQEIIANDPSNTTSDKGGLILKVDVGNIVNPIDPTLLLALEVPLSKSVSFSQELGLVTGFRSEVNIFDEFIGFKVREEMRVYIDWMSKENGKAFMSINAMYRFMDFTPDGNLGVGCADGDYWSCQYIKQIDGPIRSHKIGGEIKFGYQMNVTPRMTLEGDAGLRVSELIYSSDSGEDVIFFFDTNYPTEQETGFSTTPVFSIKIGYKL
ncbi:MAG: hypothetical protein JXR10_09660 [Cyclobacteriaceae bacterium]